MERRIDRALDHEEGALDAIPGAYIDSASSETGVTGGGQPAPAYGDGAAGSGHAAGPVHPGASRHGSGRGIIGHARIAAGNLDRASLLAAIIGGAAFLALAWVSLLLALPGTHISPVWLPNACAVAFLLRAQLRNEIPFLLAAFAAGLAANALVKLPDHVALVFALANVVEIIAVLVLTRRVVRGQSDMNQLPDLARFVWAGGLVGPVLSALMTGPVMGSGLDAILGGATGWFLTNSMAMVLIVPAALLLLDRVRGRLPAAPAHPAESFALLIGGMVCTFLVFRQTYYPLLFLIQPITLMHAFRLGSLGSALHVGGVAVVAGAMTWAGFGPIAAAGSAGGMTDLHLLQAFIAANFLTGLPVAAILAGRDRMTAALEAGKQQIDLLADNITDAILRYDMDGVCTYASPSVSAVMGVSPEAIVGKPVNARLHPDARDLTMQALGRLLGGISETERVTYRRFCDSPDGTPVFLEANCAVVRNPHTGAREGVVVAARDVTERVELEALLTRARRHAENAAQAKSAFLANMSHEIRTPMNGVLGFAELILQGDLADDQRRFAELIVQSGRSMMTLLNDVLDLSKIESGQFTIDRAPVNLHDSLAECAALHRLTAENKGLTIDFAWEPGNDPDNCAEATQPSWIMTDGLRLRQIVLNLIGNAVKFTEAGHIRVSCKITPHEVQVMIADSGIGISPDRLEAIFHPFTQGEADTARRFGGTGLGLSISRHLAALLDGRIEVASQPGVGSRFTLILPATLVQPPSRDEPVEPVKPADLPLATRILLVEDHDINRLLMTEMLERCGQDVAVAHDGNEAIAMVIDSIMRGRPYDLVLMDVQMPDCDGYAATGAIRAEGIGPGLLPIIALTANAFPEDIAAARAAGMQGHLAKPVAFAQLVRALQRWLPTRIVESSQPAATTPPAARASLLARSPQLVTRWQARRSEAADAVRAGLADGVFTLPATGPNARRDQIAALAHKLAGTAALFDEPELGACAAALERALRRGECAARCEALAQDLLALGDARPGEAARDASAS
ncbi:MAG: hypothetical protein CVT87_01245 [Alphaproteobacteria bacterium HGW-Alphaproteobacteria-9]|nr:MAG: hypothetical protein CVT87_01245 [Alphaproteobacteria bacterium HGW-Alphaproteobacteria-9]